MMLETARVGRRGGLAGSLVATIALLTACGGGPAPGGSVLNGRPPADVIDQATEIMVAAGSSRFTLEAKMETTSTGASAGRDPGGGPFLGPGDFELAGTGTYDFTREIGAGEWVNSVAGGAPEEGESVFTNNVSYERPVGESRWQKYDSSDLVNRPVGLHDPADQLALLRGVSDDVRDLGTTQVRGAEVRHYTMTLDERRLDTETDVVVEGGVAEAAASASTPVPVDVFVDNEGRVRKLALRLSRTSEEFLESEAVPPELADLPGLEQMFRDRSWTMDLEASMEFFDFGVPVTASVPDPAVVDEAR